MFNLFAISLLERLNAKKLAAIIADATDVTERTWRNRLTKGWSQSDDELKKAINNFADQLRKGGWSEDEAKEIIGRNPSWRDGAALPTANLIFHCSPKYAEGLRKLFQLPSSSTIYVMPSVRPFVQRTSRRRNLH